METSSYESSTYSIATHRALNHELFIQNADELQSVLGANLSFFTDRQPEFVQLRELVNHWGFSASKLSLSFGEGLPHPSSGAGNNKKLPVQAVLQFLYSNKNGKYSIPPFNISSDLIDVQDELSLPEAGAGIDRYKPVFGLFDRKTGRILVGSDAPIMGESIWVALLCWVVDEQDIFPGLRSLPACPADAIRILIRELGYAEEVSNCFAEESATDSFKIDPRGVEPRLAVDKEYLVLVAAKIAGGEAPYIRKCLWVAIIAASFPWSERGLIDFINRMIAEEGGEPLSRETIYARISLARSHLFLKARQSDFGYSALPDSKEVGDLLRKIPDTHLAEAWCHIDEHAHSNKRKGPVDEDCLGGWKMLLALEPPELGKQVDFSKDEQRLRDRKARGRRSKIGRKLNKKLEEVGIDDPEEAFLQVLKDMGIPTGVARNLCDDLLHG